MSKEIGKRDMQVYEKEMKKIAMKEGWEKIQAGLKDKTNGAYNLNIAQNEKKDKKKREKLE